MINKEEKFIKSYEIVIGQTAVGGIPLGPKEDAIIKLAINGKGVGMKLVDFKDMANTLWEEYGESSNKKGQEAISTFKALIAELLSPWCDYEFLRKKEITNDK